MEQTLEQFNFYLECAEEAYNNNEYLKAVSYIDTCWALNKTDEVKALREQYKVAYLNFIKTKTYSKNKVAVYAITKNEVQFIDRWIESMSEADYICVLDTGSTDGTYEKFLELAKTNKKILVAQQVFSPWRFDLPRNIAMTLVPDDANIFLSTDLDEVLEPNWYTSIANNWVEGTHERASYKYAWSHNESGNPGRVF